MGAKESKKTTQTPQQHQRHLAAERARLLSSLVVHKLEIPTPPPSPPPQHTRFVIISDTHCQTSQLQVPPGDVLVHAGDALATGTPEELQHFSAFMNSLPHPTKLLVSGNHDKPFLKPFNPPRALLDDFLKATPLHFLDDQVHLINGLKISGVPWHYDVESLQSSLQRVPPDTDILISHSPPLGYGDSTTLGRSTQHEHSGQTLLLQFIQKHHIRYHLFGHIHEAYGLYRDDQTTFVNAAICDPHDQPTRRPIVLDIPHR